MKLVWLTVFCIVAHFPLYALSATEGLTLNGAAMHIENGNTLYVGGLYLDKPTRDIATILSPDTDKVMQIVITKENRNNRGWTKYSWKGYWQNHIAINNPEASNDAKSFKVLAQFTTLVKDTLLRGDEVKIIYRSGATEVKLNGELVARSRGVQVFNHLILVWIGDVPPSAGFRKSILGDTSGAQGEANRNLLLNYKIPPKRKTLYSSWLEKESAKNDQQYAAQTSANNAAMETQRKILKDKAKQESEKLAQRKHLETKSLAKPKPINPITTKKPLRPAKPIQKPKATPNSNRLAQEAAEQQFYKDIVQWQIQRYVYNNVEYPHWARQFSNQGLVELTFQLNSKREVTFTDSPQNVDLILIKEVERAVQESISALTIPSGLTATGWPLSASYLFDLKGDQLPKPVPPLQPSHLENKTVAAEQKNALIKQYKDDVIKTIQGVIVYPERAKMSRHKGDVGANISINRWGEVINVEMVKSTRFDYLNNAVIAAIEKNAPYKTLPLEANTDLIVVLLEHRFR